MIKRLLAIAVLGVTVSGCFMAPLALVGPAASGFSTASIIQSGVTTGANYVVQKSTGKTISEHAIQAMNKDLLKHTYAPGEESLKQIHENKYLPKNELSSRCPEYDFYCKRILNKNPAAASTLLKKPASVGCKKYDFYCKRMSLKKWRQHINNNPSLLGSS